MHANRSPQAFVANAGRGVESHVSQVAPLTMPDYRFFDDQIWLGGVVADKQQARKLVEFINAMIPFLREPEPKKDSTHTGGDEQETGSTS